MKVYKLFFTFFLFVPFDLQKRPIRELSFDNIILSDTIKSGQLNFKKKVDKRIKTLNSSISSLKDLNNEFKGKALFIDLWATWCEPCLDEFKYSPELHSFLVKNHIEIIYISFDEENNEREWQTVIHKYDLLGNHIRANKSLKDDITQIIWGAKDAFSIPNYLLIDKTGLLINKHMPEPNNIQVLIKNIKDQLNLN